MDYWIITVKEPYCGYILRGMKTMEIRKSVPSTLRPDDVIFIARKGEKGHIVGACSVTSVLKGSVAYFCTYFSQRHRLNPSDLKEYAGHCHDLIGIGLNRIKLDTWCLNVRSFGFEMSPQNFYRIKPEYMSTIERVLKK